VIERTARIVAQTRTRLAGITPDSATRIVSLHDPDARPIAKGRLGKPVEFGYKAQVLDNEDGIVLDYTVEQGNPPDAPQLAHAIGRITQRTGRAPRQATADRGYGEAAVDKDLHDLGVKTVAIPRKGRPGPARQRHEHRPAFRKLVKWRTGAEGRISHLKNRYSWDRGRLDGLTGARTWCGHLRPQPGQAHRPRRDPNRVIRSRKQTRPHRSGLSIAVLVPNPLFQVEVASGAETLATAPRAWPSGRSEQRRIY